VVERARHDEAPREQRHERAQRRELEQLRRLVERRAAQQRLVAVVQAEQLRSDQQQRHADEALPRQLQRYAARRQHDRQDQCAEDRRDVGHEQRATEQCVPPQAHGRAARCRSRAPPRRVPTRAAAQPERRHP
jgi:hypothetical protein